MTTRPDPIPTAPGHAPAALGAAPLDQTFGGALAVACSRFARTAAQAVDVEASATMWRLLSTLAHTGPQTVTGLAALERTSQPTMSKVVKRLEAHALVSRTPDPVDRRSTAVSITDAGRATLARYRTSLATTLAPHLATLSADDTRTLRRALALLEQLTTQVADAGTLTTQKA